MAYWNILYDNYLNHNKYLNFDKIKIVNNDKIIDYGELKKSKNIKDLSKKICIIKLNGGLGTSMNCDRPKSLINVKNNMTFLEITLNQIREIQKKYQINLKVILMNSFYTHQETEEFIKNIDDIDITCYEQSKFIRINKKTNEVFDGSKQEHFYPPGHGDLFQSLYDKNILEKLIEDKYEYLFVSNIDNLGSTINFRILDNIIQNDIDYCLETTEKTKHDIKGGTIIEYDNKHMIFEIAQCHPDNLNEFMNFKYFNTNNVWCKIKSIYNLVKTHDYLKNIDLIINPKKLNQDNNEIECIQLEFAIGSLIKFFDKTQFINVSRKRFIPVKNLSDLLLIMSNLYELNDRYKLKLMTNEIPIIQIKGITDLKTFIKCFNDMPLFDHAQHITVDVITHNDHYSKTIIYNE